MNVHIDIDAKYEQIAITVHAKEWSPEVEALVQRMQRAGPQRIVGVADEQSILLHPNEIDFVFAQERKVFAAMHKQRIELKMKLYEAEKLLETFHFTRFSKSVIGNMQRIERFELAFNGNLCVHFRSGNKEYVSRKYVNELKRKLTIGGDSNGV